MRPGTQRREEEGEGEAVVGAEEDRTGRGPTKMIRTRWKRGGKD